MSFKHIADILPGELNPAFSTLGKRLANEPTGANAHLTYAIERFRKAAAFDKRNDVEEAIEAGCAAVQRAWSVAESPIEKLLAPYLVFQDYGPLLVSPAVVRLPGSDETGNIVIEPQRVSGSFRFDFVVTATLKDGRVASVIVECDGAGYHDVAADWERDQHFAHSGIRTVRADGRRIHREPEAVARDVAIILANWAGGES